MKGREPEEGDPDKRQLMDDLKVNSLKERISYLTIQIPSRSTMESTLMETVIKMKREQKSRAGARTF